MSKKNKSVLIVDDDLDFLKAQEYLLQTEGLTVTTAESFRSAQHLLREKRFDLIISDVRMPGGSGTELLAWTQKEGLSVPFVLITGFSDLLTAQTAKELGAFGFLPKPVRKDELLAMIATFGAESESSLEFKESEFGRIAIEDFVSGKTLTVSIYVRFKDGRFIKLAHTGEDLEFDRISALKEKGVHDLWIEKADFDRYQKLNQHIAKAVVASSGELSKKIRVLNHSCEVAFESVRLMGLSANGIETAKAVFQDCLEVLVEDGCGFDLLDRLHQGPKSLTHHSSAVGMLCGVLPMVMGWYSKKNIQALTLGGFLHDIGMLGTDFSVHGKDPKKVTLESDPIYFRHPIIGANLVDGITGIPPEVGQIILHHHENGRGSGFPYGKLGSQIFPLAKIVTLIDEFVDHCSNIDYKRPFSPVATLNELLIGRQSFFDPAVVLALKSLLNADDIESAANDYNRELKKIVRA